MTLEQNALPAKILAVLSIGLFWLVPFSPFISMAAVKATNRTPGWPRHVARTGAILTMALVAYFTLAVLWMTCVIIWNPTLA